MWKDKLKEVIYILENSDINEIEVRFWFRKIKVTKTPPIINSDFSDVAPNVITSTPDKPSVSVEKEENDTLKIDTNTFTVRSPMPGTFYSASDPDSKPFAEVNGAINQGDTICIVEAMKIMNEIESEKSGTIKKLLVDDGSAVDYNQPLFLIDPS